MCSRRSAVALLAGWLLSLAAAEEASFAPEIRVATILEASGMQQIGDI